MADLCVIFNPTAGKHRARQRLDLLEKAWGSRAVFQATQGPGHAAELARRAALDGFNIVAAAGGDGTVHEVANGLLEAERPAVRFGVVPIGSANDYAHSLEFEADGAKVRNVDVGVVRTAEKQRYFVCCLGLGLNGAVTLESRKIRRLQGILLYGLATVRALLYHYACPAMEFAFDDEPARVEPTLMFSVLLGRREGGFVLAPRAKLDDGWFDYVQCGALSRFEVLRFLPRVALFGPPEVHPKIRQGQCRRVRLTSPTVLTVHIDGEFFARPEDDIREIEIEILPGRLAVQMDLNAGV